MEIVRIGRHKYSDPDVISLIRATGGLTDPRCIVVNLARKLAQKYRSFDGSDVGPLKRLEIIASFSGLTVTPMDIEQRKTEPRDAVLILNGRADGRRGQVFYNPKRPQGRVAFSIAHEISHTFFPNTVIGARFRDLCGSKSREANELERLCDLAASELLMPADEFRREACDRFSMTELERLTQRFGSSFESTVFRLATAHPGVAVAGLLKFRFTKNEERLRTRSIQQVLFDDAPGILNKPPEAKYRRQSFFASSACGDEYTIRWNKSFSLDSCVYRAAKSEGMCFDIEALPNDSGQAGLLEVVRAPFQREDANPEFPDLLFFWSTLLDSPVESEQVTFAQGQPDSV
jgi:Zn-dependent peptidase ImmA (M78 family)